ncbi:SIR2 family protein [Rahnella victoriana]|nr:SIR2 family protein [Rahnella victoriana]
MKNTLLFGNGINRLSTNAVSWSQLLDKIKGVSVFQSGELPNTMIYERIFMEKYSPEECEQTDELEIKQVIADALQLQNSNETLESLASLDIENYLTTNYDYAFEKALGITPEKLSTEDVYSLRRKRKYDSIDGVKFLWNIHGEIGQPKTIMLGLDHYIGSVSKIDSYVKGTYSHTVDGKEINVAPMLNKLEKASFCFTSWIDLFFSSNVHIVGFSLDYSEIDIWWLLNKRARFSARGLVSNKIYFYTNKISSEKSGLLKSFNVEVVEFQLTDNDYKEMYSSAIKKMNNNLKG